jgi:hypothetical protein
LLRRWARCWANTGAFCAELAHLEQLLKLTGEQAEEDPDKSGQELLLGTRLAIPVASPTEAKEATEGDGASA